MPLTPSPGPSDAFLDLDAFEERIKTHGWVLFPWVLDDHMVQRLREDLARACEICRAVRIRNGVDEGNEGTAHHILSLGESFMEFLERQYLFRYIDRFFQGPFILNSFGGVINPPDGTSYVGRMHRDVRTFCGDLRLMLNMLVMLDDFTLENGATHFLSGSHRVAERPGEAEFTDRSECALGTTGSIVLFDSNLWHAAGHNRSGKPRRAITPTFTRPFVKQQFDYPRAFGYQRAESLSEELKQVLGYNSRVPASLDDWYQPPAKRFYRPGQG